jgi:acetyl esterase/lipase
MKSLDDLAPENAAFFSFTWIPKPAQQEGEIALYRTTEPPITVAGGERWNRAGNGHVIVRNVLEPTLTPFLPSPESATGEAVIVIPGGGFQMLAMSNEGWPASQWLADRGIAAFLLKYRLNPTPQDETVFAEEALRVVQDVISARLPRRSLLARSLWKMCGARWQCFGSPRQCGTWTLGGSAYWASRQAR